VPVSDLRIAVLVNRYPSVTHSFIRREILGLERAGTRVLRVSIGRAPEALVDPLDREEAERTRVVLANGVPGLAAALAAALLSRPRAVLGAARLAAALARESDRGRLWHLAYLAEACVLLRWCRAERIVHVHAHFGTNGCAVAALLRALGGPPYSFTVHGPEEFGRPLALAAKRAGAAFVVTPSEHGRRELERISGGASGVPVHVIRCGVDAGFLDAEPAEIPAAPRLVCVGRLLPRKGHALLLDAVAALARADVACELVLIGDGPERPALEARSRALGIAASVRFRGWTGEEQVRRDIVAARALVLPSFAEGLAVVLMEALALGRPVVCSDVGGHAELVESGVNGWRIPAGSQEALVAALREVLGSAPAELARLGRAGHARVRERHDAGREAARLAALLRASQGIQA
jgi:glycosyltransferase involved in cell wall biosynthesis